MKRSLALACLVAIFFALGQGIQADEPFVEVAPAAAYPLMYCSDYRVGYETTYTEGWIDPPGATVHVMMHGTVHNLKHCEEFLY